jgi:hypothetical protein
MAESKSAAILPKRSALRVRLLLRFRFGASRLRCSKAADFDSAKGKLGWLDSNQRMAESKSAALPLGYTPSGFATALNLRRILTEQARGAVSVQSYAPTCSPGLGGSSRLRRDEASSANLVLFSAWLSAATHTVF